jgi:hypothetical protein
MQQTAGISNNNNTPMGFTFQKFLVTPVVGLGEGSTPCFRLQAAAPAATAEETSWWDRYQMNAPKAAQLPGCKLCAVCYLHDGVVVLFEELIVRRSAQHRISRPSAVQAELPRHISDHSTKTSTKQYTTMVPSTNLALSHTCFMSSFQKLLKLQSTE